MYTAVGSYILIYIIVLEQPFQLFVHELPISIGPTYLLPMPSKEGRGLRLTQRLLAGGEVEDEDEVGERSVSVSTPYSY